MGYAINGSSMRAVESSSDLFDGETYSETLPVVWPPDLTTNEKIQQQILDLEALVTERRYREAVLGIDNGWLRSINTQIDNLRKSMT